MPSKKCGQGNVHLIGLPENKEKALLENSINSLNKARKILKYDKRVDVVIISAQDFFVIPELGISGSAIGKYCIEIKINFSRKDLKEIINIALPLTVYHELAHLVREDSCGDPRTLLDSLISEGISCFVEKSIPPNGKLPYIKKIKNEKKLLKKAGGMLKKTRYDYSEWFFGSGRLPKWAGYRLGFFMVESFIKNNKIPLEKLVRLDSKKILKGSNIYN